MKNYILIVALTALHTIEAQPPLDTIYANSSKNVALFFPKPTAKQSQGLLVFYSHIIGKNHNILVYYKRIQGQKVIFSL